MMMNMEGVHFRSKYTVKCLEQKPLTSLFELDVFWVSKKFEAAKPVYLILNHTENKY